MTQDTVTHSSERSFDVPVALFLFRRAEAALRVVNVLSQVRPTRLYLLGDGPRNTAEIDEVLDARAAVEAAIDWPCEVVRHYADSNRGVYANIAGGAKWVLEREDAAIFLEDDNLPEATFFAFCREMLERYRSDTRVLWICGTNYLEEFQPESGSSYVFTKHLMPCGWASWSSKFSNLYDGDMHILEDRAGLRRMRMEYTSSALYRQQVNSARAERWRRMHGQPYSSWDHQMAMSIRSSSVYGICPCRNQIKNIGADQLSTHGGTSLAKVMTRRFCGIGSTSIEFPLSHPPFVLSDLGFERAVDRVILLPLLARLRGAIVALLKAALGMSRFEEFSLRRVGSLRGRR